MAEVAINSWTHYGEDRDFAPDAIEPKPRVWARNMLAARTDAWMSALADPQEAVASGDASEHKVGARLDKLTARGWRVLHSIPIGPVDGAADHVLIGPGGVFCLNIRNYHQSRVWVSDKVVWVDGECRPHVRNAQFESERATRILSRAVGSLVEVRPVLVIMGDKYTPTKHRRDVTVLGRRDIPRAFSGMPATYTADEVAAIHAAAQRPETWA